MNDLAVNSSCFIALPFILNKMNYLRKLSLLVLLVCCAAITKAQTTSTPRPYSPYRVLNGTIYLSGQIGISQTTGKLVDASFEQELAEVMKNIKTILAEAGSDLSSVVNVIVYLKDMDRYAEFNKLYVTYFNAPLPARTCIAIKDLPAGANIEIAVTAGQKGAGK